MNRSPKLGPLTSLFFLVAIIAMPNLAVAQIYTPLYDLGSQSGDPQGPQGHFVQARDGNLYNTSPSGGSNGYGTVFQLTPGGKMKVLWNFSGGNPDSGNTTTGLTLGTDGALYGSTPGGGTGGNGIVFKLTTGGKFTVLHNFLGLTDGSSPSAPVQGSDGNFYGAASNGTPYYGTIYKMTPAGVVTPIYEFTGSPDVAYRYPQGLIQGNDGNFYGTTNGGVQGLGMVFKITLQGKLTKLHEFIGSPTDGQAPVGFLIQGSDGNFYGETSKGGTGGFGTVYKMTPAGAVTIVHNFDESSGGRLPSGGLVQGTDGNFYGVTYSSGEDHGVGLIFQITPEGAYNTIYEGFSYPNGTNPLDALIQHTNGTFYSDTRSNGTGTACFSGSGCGVLYSLNMELGPFVTFLPMRGKVGKTIGIFGQGFTGTSRVSFDGIASSFTVVSNTYLTATVPAGAKTGPIHVTTSGGKLNSSKTFLVTPQLTNFAPTSGSVGAVVTITGVSLDQTSKVTFGGIKATTFTVISDTQVNATVPTGAKTGVIVVTTAGGIATSTNQFTVTP